MTVIAGRSSGLRRIAAITGTHTAGITMQTPLDFFISVWIKFFFLFTPFFALSIFLSMTGSYADARRRRLAVQVTAAVGALCFLLFFYGNVVFKLFGITLDSFRIGAGALLFLSAVGLVQAKVPEPAADDDIAVVPLAMPIIVGPATIGTLLVLGAEITNATQKLLGCLALVLAILSVGLLLLAAGMVERLLGKKIITILSKVTGLVLASLAAQMIFTGIRNFFTPSP
jgi:multiple antibiotic resistance protein